jgi:hypothetical protein
MVNTSPLRRLGWRLPSKPTTKPRDWNERVKNRLALETALKALLRTPPPDEAANGKPRAKKSSKS